MTPAEVEDACSVLAESNRMSVLEFLSLRNKLLSGEWRAVMRRSSEGVAVVVLAENSGWRVLVAAHGPQPGLRSMIKELCGRSEGVIWDEGVVPLDAPALDELGFFPVERQSFIQDLALVPLEHPEPDDLEVSVFTKADHQIARQLFAATHVMTVAGLYTTLPYAPTLERCAIEFDDYMAGVQGEPVPSACLVTKLDGKMVGVVCCSKTDEEDTAVLLGLGVDPTVRGKGLSRILVRRAQRALKAAGFAKMLFVTTDGNTPVHRLFTPEEIVGRDRWPARLWVREGSPMAAQRR